MKLPFILISIVLRAWLATSSSPGTPVVDTTMVAMLKSCYSDRMNTLVIAGNVNYFNENMRSALDNVPLIFIGQNLGPQTTSLQSLRLETFVVTAGTTDELKSTLQKLKQINLWNIKATFLIAAASSQDCQDAFGFLNIAWKMNLLSSTFLCSSTDTGVKLFTYNPYTSRAPLPWKKEDQGFDTRWTLYSQPYIQDQIICESLAFDKRKFLDGYNIRATAISETGKSLKKGVTYGIKSMDAMLRSNRKQYLSVLFSKMNVTPMIRYDLSSWAVEVVANSLKPGNVRTYDIVLNTYPMEFAEKWDIYGTYPSFRTRMGLLTQHRGFLTPVEKISTFFSPNLLILIGLVLIMTFICLALYKKQGYKSASFEVLRLVVNTNFLNPISTVAMRIYLIPVFFLFLIVNATFTGHFSAFLTKQDGRKDAENFETLRKFQFELYSTASIKRSILPADWPNEYLHILPNLNCTKDIGTDPFKACIAPLGAILPAAIHSHLHCKEINLPTTHYLNFWARDDWPLAETIDSVTFRLLESGLIDYWTDQTVTHPLEKLDARVEAEEMPQIRKIKFEDIKFAFVILIIGLGSSTIVFIAEIISKKMSVRTDK